MTDWDECWRRGETPWDKGHASPPLTGYLEAGDSELQRARRVLVPGCGSGHDVRELARHGILATGLDISAAAVARAREIPPAGGEDYIEGDLFATGWRTPRAFDAVWEHTCFCAIDPALRQDYARAMAEILPPGGWLAGVFYLNPRDDGEASDGPPFGATREEIAELLQPWFVMRKEQVPDRSYPGREGREWLAVFERLPDPVVADMRPFA